MGKLDGMGMQGLACHQRIDGLICPTVQVTAIDRPATVHAIGHDRVAKKAHVHAKLVRPAGLRIELHQSKGSVALADRTDAFAYLVLGHSRLGAGGIGPACHVMDSVLLAHSRMLANRHIDYVGIAVEEPVHNGGVGLVNFSQLELPA